MFEEQFPSKEDEILLKNLSLKGENVIEDLYKIFSYHRPKEYKIYVENIKYNPLDKNKIHLDLITTLQKYNELFTKKKELFKDIGQSNRLFHKLYLNKKNSEKSVTSRKSDLFNNLLPKYEKKHMIFNNKFLNKNIFHKCGLLPHSLKQIIDFFSEEIKQNGINSSNSLKYINFIEKLDAIAQNTLDRKTIHNYMSIYENKEEKSFQLRQERILKTNFAKAERKEIEFEKKEIRKLTKLIDLLNKNKKSKSKNKSKNNGIDSDEEIDKAKKIKNNIRLIKWVRNEKSEKKESIYKLYTKNMNRKNASLFSDHSSNTNNTTSFNNGHTISTAFGDTKNNNNNFSFYNIHNDLINRLNNIKIKKIKQKEQSIFKQLPIIKRTLSRNKTNVSLLPLISPKNINEKDNTIKIKTNLKTLKSSSSVPLIENLDSNKEKNKQKQSKKNIKEENRGITEEQRKKVPLIYEQLKKIKNELYLNKINLSQSSKTYELLHKIYSKNKILNVNPKEVPKDLYNYYYNMSNAIERKTKSNLDFQKYKKLLDKKTEHNLEINQEQDEKLKSKYLDLVHTLIKRKLPDVKEDYI